MMTKRPWPPLHRQQLPLPPPPPPPPPPPLMPMPIPINAKLISVKNGSRYAAAVAAFRAGGAAPPPPKYVARDCYIVAAPVYQTVAGTMAVSRTSSSSSPSMAAVPFLPPVGLLKRMMVVERKPRERVHFKQTSSSSSSSDAKCLCSCVKVRSRSLENLCPSDVTSSTTDEREVSVRRRRKGKENFKRRSMENLLDSGGVAIAGKYVGAARKKVYLIYFSRV